MSAILFFFCAFAAQAADDLMTKQIAINVAEAGTLASKVGSADKYKITSLRLTGCLNAEDMKFIREMAGCCYDESGSRYGGHLRHLDMADAKFVGEGSFELYHPDPNSKGRFYKETGVIKESRVGRFQFAFLDSLQTVVLPKNTTEIGYSGFNGCSSLTSVSLPDGLTTMGEWAFTDCTALASVSLPESLTFINGQAFLRCASLTSVSLPKDLTYLGDLAFAGCANLASVSLPDGLAEINGYTFAYTGLTSVEFPKGLTKIGYFAFVGCANLTSVSLPEGLAEIGGRAFYDCGNLASVSLPASLAKLGNYPFDGCNNLTAVYAYMPTPTKVDGTLFESEVTENATLYVPQGHVQDYRAADYWGDFKNIVEFNPAGVEPVPADARVEESARYSLGGHRLAAPAKGLNIVKYSDGTAKKVIVR